MSKANTTVPHKHIQVIEILSCYESGLPGIHQSNGLTFNWCSWVLCEVAYHSTNPVHQVICTNFHADNYRQVGIAQRVKVAIWNPSYDTPYKEDVSLDKLHYWCPISVIREGP